MEHWHQRVFLTAALSLAALTGTAAKAETGTDLMSVIDPDIERRDVTPPDIDSEDFEVGPYVGLLAIQDFDADWVYGIRAAWHVSEDFFFEANYGQSQGDLTSFEKLSGGAPLFDDSERDYTFYDINIAWNALPGEIFLFGQRALKSDLYLVLGAGNTDFLGDNWFTVNIGAGYRLLLNDWLALRLDVRDHIFDRDTFGESEITHNVELATTLTYFF